MQFLVRLLHVTRNFPSKSKKQLPLFCSSDTFHFESSCACKQKLNFHYFLGNSHKKGTMKAAQKRYQKKRKRGLILWLKLLIIKFPINNRRESKKKLFNFLSTFNDSRLIPLLTSVIFYNFRIAFNRWAASLRWSECRNFFNGFENNSLAIIKHKGRVSMKIAQKNHQFFVVISIEGY